jgi:hypothetical protein
MDILKDPGDQMNALLDVFAYRALIVNLLLDVSAIHLSVAKLLIVLELIKRLDADTIRSCLE